MTSAMTVNDTIFALSSGSIPSGVAVVRISGPDAVGIVSRLVGRTPTDRRLMLHRLNDDTGQAIDHAMVVAFRAPHSFTGEDCAELHLHGGRAVVARTLAWLGSQPRCRQAEAGEFTRRAYINGKVDLIQAEALADLIEADTDVQRRHALDNASAGTHDMLHRWRDLLLTLRSAAEASIDFADEDDVEASNLSHPIALLIDEMASYLHGGSASEIIRDGYRVVLAGSPNAGKSSLFNALLRREAAIVSPQAGTTRDVLEATLDVAGYKVILTDTAGLRITLDDVEAQGVKRAEKRIDEADLVLFLEDGTGSGEMTPPAKLRGDVITVHTKSDLVDEAEKADGLWVSTLTSEGLGTLVDEIANRIRARTAIQSAVPFRARQVALVSEARDYLVAAADEQAFELQAELIRRSGDCIGRLTGQISTEEMLGSIFSRFCIGK